MPTQFPTISIKERAKLLNTLQSNTLYPYTYFGQRQVDNTNFPTTGIGFSSDYNRLSFTAPTALGIVAIKVTANLYLATGTFAPAGFYGFVVSYRDVISFDDAPLGATTPSDSGNDIYRIYFDHTMPSFNDYLWLQPNDFYMSTGQILYLYTTVNHADALVQNVVLSYSITLYTQPTGLSV